MRRFSIIFLTLTLLFIMTGCKEAQTGEKQLPKADAVLSGKITQLYDDSFLLAGTEKSEIYMISSTNVYDAENQITDASALKAGQNVEIGYSGDVMESYPAQLGTPIYIKIIEQGDDLIGFYQGVFNDLWKVDDALNADVNLLAFDLSKVTNLTDSEKSALVYLLSTAHGLEGITGTFDELSEQGYIDRENLYFERGILFDFELSDITDKSFTFDASKWRSGTGAYYFHNCKAIQTDKGWSYTVGSEMIS